MITISNCTPDDCPAVATMWNAKTADATSCWYQAAGTSATLLSSLLAGGHTIILLKQDGLLAAFGLVNGPVVHALRADSQADLYRLMIEWTAQNIAAGRISGSSIVENKATSEKSWIDALGDALAQVPYASDPLTREVVLLKVTCNFQSLRDALVARLTEMGALP